MLNDNTEIFRQRIEPLLQQIRIICSENKIPYFAAFAVKVHSDGSIPDDGFKCETILPDVMGIPSGHDRRFAEFINVADGVYDYIHAKNAVEISKAIHTDAPKIPNIDE